MDYFIDTEFIEDGKTIDLISLAVVREDGAAFYGCSEEARLDRASPWVRQNVLPHLPPYSSAEWMRRAEIRLGIERIVGTDQAPRFWAYYADYDWVAVCQLFGTMMDLPAHFPMLCLDLKQVALMIGCDEKPEKPATEHDALADARWNHEYFALLRARAEAGGLYL